MSFFGTKYNGRHVVRVYSQYCKEQDRRTLVDLYYQDDQFLNSGNAYVQDSYNEKVNSDARDDVTSCC